ncbi:hypothetical protein ACH42_11175 [Endozoicomonas sp. (ex Bugula neritina AB1)]|nr:hypothetical protein ACH42_11175 [Endozoicomonas sp. (ex Bugula neritina AB1)]
MFILTTVISLSQPPEAVEPHYHIAMKAVSASKKTHDQSCGAERSDYFPSLLEAVVTASNLYNPLSIREDTEYIGAILRNKDSGLFCYTVTAGHQGRDKVSTEISIPDDHEVSAFWHTHGEGKEHRQFFSATDMQLVKQWQLPLYLADYTGWLKVLKPDDRSFTHHQARVHGIYYATKIAPGNKVSNSAGQLIRIKIHLNH